MLSRVMSPPPLLEKIHNRSLAILSKDPDVFREESYYRENIKKISNVDEFIKNKRVFHYALKAFDILDMKHAEKFMKDILISDLSDPESLVNKMNSLKYQKFARYYDFSPAPKNVQGDIQKNQIIKDYIQSHKLTEKEALEKSEYFRHNIHKISSIDQFFKNKDLLNYVLQSFKIDPHTVSLPFLKDALTLGLAKPDKYFITSQDNRFRTMAEHFHFQKNGSANDKILTNAQIENIVSNYLKNTLDCIPENSIISDQKYYKETIGSIHSFPDLLKDSKLFQMVHLALFSSNSDIKADNLLDLVRKNDPRVSKIKDFFHIDFSNIRDSNKKIQNDDQITKILNLYKESCKKLHEQKMNSLIAEYRKSLHDIKSIQDFLYGKNLLNYDQKPFTALDFALKAYNIKGEDLDKYKLKSVLTSNASDPNSYVNKSKDKRLIKLNNAFNFNSNGSIGEIPTIQSRSVIRENIINYVNSKRNLYNEKKSFDSENKIHMEKKLDSEAKYYSENIDSIHSFEDLFTNRKILNFLLESKEIDPKKVDDNFLHKIFRSDLKNPNSLANTHQDSRYKDIISSFNFDIRGEKLYKEKGAVQDDLHLDKTCDLYKNQIIEKEEEQRDPDNALEIYFKRNIPNIRNYYEILGDKKLFQVVAKKLNLSPYLPEKNKLDMLQKNINIKDFKNPKKVDAFIYAFRANKFKNIDYKKSLFSFANKQERYLYDYPENQENTMSLQLNTINPRPSNGRYSTLDLFIPLNSPSFLSL
ncbi:hypothetical protein G293_04860 [Candidatus Liberibacter africanus PTSAPSY]|uniref:Uncharacterized protein n=2 Tax=Liberibacter africanus TaxID=34020 RepID=A0A0G3I9V7_LIBAF|nr:hypothetical protein G293_04860 [Candidatus Liberibacter africanus PTSAPSY]